MSGSAAAGDELTAALSADLATRLRASPESVAVEDGWAVRCDALPAIHHLNSVVLGTGAPLVSATEPVGLVTAC